MKYYIELNGEEPTTAIEDVLDREFGRNCKCGYLDEFDGLTWHTDDFPTIEPNCGASECVLGIKEDGSWIKCFYFKNGRFIDESNLEVVTIVKWTYIKV